MDENSWAPASHLVPHWMQRLLEDYQDEVLASETGSWSILYLERSARKTVWGMCAMLGVDIRGVPGQACRLLEKYLFHHVRECARAGISEDEKIEFKRSLAARIPLLIASSIQLASKMTCASLQLNPTLVRSRLLCKGIDYSVQDIVGCEFQVFSTVGFRVPLWTCVEAAELLAIQAGFPAALLPDVGVVVDVAEYRLDVLNRRVRSVANLNSTFNKNANLRTLHIAAGAVSASASFLGFQGPNPTKQVADLTRAPTCYIKCIADVLLADILVDKEIETLMKRRKQK